MIVDGLRIVCGVRLLDWIDGDDTCEERILSGGKEHATSAGTGHFIRAQNIHRTEKALSTFDLIPNILHLQSTAIIFNMIIQLSKLVKNLTQLDLYKLNSEKIKHVNEKFKIVV